MPCRVAPLGRCLPPWLWFLLAQRDWIRRAWEISAASSDSRRFFKCLGLILREFVDGLKTGRSVLLREELGMIPRAVLARVMSCGLSGSDWPANICPISAEYSTNQVYVCVNWHFSLQYTCYLFSKSFTVYTAQSLMIPLQFPARRRLNYRSSKIVGIGC